ARVGRMWHAVRGRRDRPPRGGRGGRRTRPRGRARLPDRTAVGRVARAAWAPGHARPRGPGAGAGAPRGRRARRLPRRPLARVRLAHARCAPPAWPGRGPCRPGLRRWGERARRGVLLPRRSVQPRPAPLVLRHVDLIPVAALALAFGRLGGTLGAGATLVLYASVVLPALERSGLTPETMEGLVTFALVGGVGALGGTLTTRARRQRARYETILTVQRALADVTPLEAALRSVRAVLLDRLRAADVGLVVRDGEREVVVGA